MPSDTNSRIYSIDFLRGLVMIIMALDHTRDFFHADAFVHDPLDLQTTTPLLFFTRWITHFCAPVFVFLSGLSIYLQSTRKSQTELGSFLIKRGLWLVLVEVLIISFLWTFDFGYRSIILQVIWAIGISMVLMGFIIRLPYSVILWGGVFILISHNILNYYPDRGQGFLNDLLINGNFATYTPISGHNLVIIYPFVPWLGLMMLGYAFGKLYSNVFSVQKRKQWLLATGAGMLVFFIFLRWSNLYGDPKVWQMQKDSLYTLLSFVDLNKYPPSLLFVCMTIGIGLLILAFSEKLNNRLSRIISLYGRVPFFYYILHFLVLHLLCMALFMFRGHSFFEVTPDVYGIPFRFLIVGEGYDLKTVYVIWMAVVAALYPPCWLYNKVKTEKKYNWMRYL